MGNINSPDTQDINTHHLQMKGLHPTLQKKVRLLARRALKDPHVLSKLMERAERQIRVQLPEIYRHIASLALSGDGPFVIQAARFLAERFDPGYQKDGVSDAKVRAKELVDLIRDAQRGKQGRPKILKLKQIEQEITLDLGSQAPPNPGDGKEIDPPHPGPPMGLT